MAASNNDANNDRTGLDWPVSSDVLTKHVLGLDARIDGQHNALNPPWSGTATFKGRTGAGSDDGATPPNADPVVLASDGDAASSRDEWQALKHKAAAKSPLPARAAAAQTQATRRERLARSRTMVVALGIATAVAAAEAVYIGYGQWLARAPSNVAEAAALAVAPALPLTAPTVPSPRTVPQATSVRGGRVVVRTEPPGAQVLVDGRASGVTPATLEDVTPGARTIVVKRAGAEARQTIEVEPGGTVSVIVPLPSSPSSSFGWLAVSSSVELDISERDALLGTSRSPQIMLEAGTHELALVNDELEFRRPVTVRVDPGKVQQLQVVPPQGVIHLNARPWAEVSIDGKAIGETPLGNVRIAIGTHEIVFRHPDHGERRVRTLVQAITPARVSVDMAQAPVTR
jgi:PEGA domain